MPAPDGPQFQTVYRGLHNVHPDDLDTSNIGAHWTTDYDTAVQFAGGRESGMRMKKATMDKPVSSTVLTAKVHPRNILSNDSDEASAFDVYTDESENEVFLRDHAPVHIENIQHILNTMDQKGMLDTQITDVPMNKRIRTRSHLKWSHRYDDNYENFSPWKEE